MVACALQNAAYNIVFLLLWYIQKGWAQNLKITRGSKFQDVTQVEHVQAFLPTLIHWCLIRGS